MRKLILSTLAGLFLVGVQAHGFGAIVVFNFNDATDATSKLADTVAANVTGTPNYNAGAGLSQVDYTTGGVANGSANARGFNPSGDAGAALTANNYWTFTVTATAGNHLNLTSLVFDEKRGEDGPVDFQVELNGTLLMPALSSTESYVNHVIDLSAPAYDNLASVTIRMVAWNADNNGSSAQWFNDNVTLNGDVVANVEHAPEPATLALWAGFGIIGLVAARRRKLLLATAN